MKIKSVHHLTSDFKQDIINRIINGEKLSILSKEVNISRTSLYKWLSKKSLRAKNPSGKYHWRKIKANKERRMINLAMKYPDYSIRKISLLSGLSVGFVWLSMKKHSLSRIKQRGKHSLRQGISLYKNVKSADKVVMIDRYKSGESITRICRNYGVSRTIFYKWLNKSINKGNKYETFQINRPKGGAHWRFIPGVDQFVLAMSASQPELSISKMHNSILIKHKKLISRSGLYYVLKRHDLNTYRQRWLYSQAVKVNVENRHMLNWEKALLFMEFMVVSASSFVVSFGILVISLNGTMLYKQISNNILLPAIIKEEETQGYKKEQIYIQKYKSEEIVYIVKDGDNLWHISQEIFDNGYIWIDIAGLNKLRNPDLIEIGQRLIIPIVESKNMQYQKNLVL